MHPGRVTKALFSAAELSLLLQLLLLLKLFNMIYFFCISAGGFGPILRRPLYIDSKIIRIYF